jgi:hypothetical protein
VAEIFRNARKVLATTAGTAIYTVPVATTAVVIGCQVTNDGTASYDLTMYWTDDSASDAVTYLAQGIPVPDASAYEPIGGKLVLEEGDALFAFGSTADVLDVTVSVLEIL